MNDSGSGAPRVCDQDRIVIIGAGPAGLTAAYELAGRGIRSVVLERDALVGGLARTEEYKGYLFDIGGHRFFTKVAAVEKIWIDILGSDFRSCPRLSRIYYKRKFFQYPLEPVNALLGLGLIESVRCCLSYLKARMFPIRPETTFTAWVSNRFGKRLFETFFESYTVKVWGIRCDQIQAEWAAQRIRSLSLASVVRSALFGSRGGPADDASASKQKTIKTLIREFHYPRRGPGMMWSRCKELVEAAGSEVTLRAPVEKIRWEPGRVLSVDAGGRRYTGSHFVSTMPIREMLHALDPAPPADVLRAAGDFHYRDFLLVALIVQAPDLFPDNWIYVHEPEVKVARIQNFKNWSEDMVPDGRTSCLGLEYFCFEGDGLWNTPDDALIALGSAEVLKLGLIPPDTVVDGKVVRVRKAYPVYDDTYRRGLDTVQRFLRSVPNLQLVGRNGMHRYNNQDHSMLTAILAVRNILGAHYDLWNLNVDEEYQEDGFAITEADLKALESTQPQQALPQQFLRAKQ
jgi:protoporphyrinogen oxidase